MRFDRHQLLLPVVFLTGAAVLVIEVTATRLLAPYFGNTIYTFSSVIGVILAALSVGYYLGGILADRRPTHGLFYALITVAGASALILHFAGQLLLPAIGYKLSAQFGPLVLSVVLFLAPAFLLGMLSPFAVKLVHTAHSHAGVGSIAGKVYFWSTLGSIAGSLTAGFILIPHLRVSTIMLSTACLLLFLGIAGMISCRTPRA